MKEQFTKITIEDLHYLSRLDRSAILCYIAMRIYGGQDRRSWASQERIAKDIDVSTPSVRRAFSKLRKLGFITKIKKGNKITSTHIINDMSNLRSANIKSDIKDISNPIKTDIISDIQIDKENNKLNNIINKSDSRSKLGSIPQEDNHYNPKVKSKDASFIAINECSNEHQLIDELDLLFEKLWSRHSVPMGWISSDPLRDFTTIRKDFTRIQIVKALKLIDYLIRNNKVGSGKWKGRNWIDGMQLWISRQSDTWSYSDSKRFKDCIHVSPSEIDKRNRSIQAKMKEQKDLEDIKLTGSRARDFWSMVVKNNATYEERYAAVLKSRIYLDPLFVRQINDDPKLNALKLLVSLQSDLYAAGGN